MEHQSHKAAWISFFALVLAAIISGIFSIWHPHSSESTFSGLVRSTSGESVSGAQIIFAEDQQTPQATTSDASGIFHVQVGGSSKTLHLFVTAKGYNKFDRDANPHRTGVEVIDLTPTQLIPNANDSSAKSAKSAPQGKERSRNLKENKEKRSSPPSIQSPGIPPQEVEPTCGPGVVNCNLAPNQGDQSTHIYGESQPPPTASFYPTPLAPLAVGDANSMTYNDEGELAQYPGVIIDISVSRDFRDPTFQIVCSSPCRVTQADARLTSPSSEMVHTVGIRYRTAPAPNGGLYALFTFPNGTLEAGQGILCRLRSLTSDPISIVSVKSLLRR